MSGGIWIWSEDQAAGPYEEEDLRGWLATAAVTREQYAWREGMAEWRPLGELLPAPVKKTEAPFRPIMKPAASERVRSNLNGAVGVLVFIRGVNILLGISGFGQLIGASGGGLVAAGGIYLGLAYGTHLEFKLALIAAMLLFVADAILGLVLVEPGRVPPIGGLVVKFFLLKAMWKGLEDL